MTLDEQIEHCKSAIKVCENRIYIEGDSAEPWIKLKQLWEAQLHELEFEKSQDNNI